MKKKRAQEKTFNEKGVNEKALHGMDDKGKKIQSEVGIIVYKEGW